MRTKFNDFIFDSERGFFIIANSNSTVNYRDASEDYLLQVLKNTTDTTSTSMELESRIKDWPSLYHFSAKRGNIFRALDFLSHNSKVLELGAGCGAITRSLGESFETVHAVEGNQVRASVAKERCRDLENVKVFCANIQDISFEKKYDVVTLIGVLEYAPVFYENFNDPNDACLAMIKDALRALKPEGVLVLAIENKIGLKYWCGCKEDHTGRLFDGIHGYPIKNTPITYSKKQLSDILKTAGFDFQDYYYPFPDYKLCDVVIRNVKNPEKYYLHNWLNFPFEDYNGRSFIFHEGLTSRTLIKAGLFDEFANSFLVVASPTRKRTYDKPSWVVKKFAKHNSWAHRYHHIISLCETNEEVKIVRKSFSSEYDSVNGKLKFTLNDAEFVRGDLFTFSAYEALFSKDFQKSFLALLNELKDKLLSEFHTGEMDKEGYPLLEGSAIDCTLWNLIKNENGLFFIDIKWNWLEQISIDYVLFRNLHYFLPKVYHYFDIGRDGLPDFIVSLLSKLYPSYNLNRHRENIKKENEFTHFVRGNTDLTPLSSVRTSIIIVTYNSLADVRKCIDSVVNNTSFPYEIIVIDNASSDDTQEYLKTLKNAKIILNSTNNGFSKGCNQGIQIAKGDYVVLLNPDTIVTQDWDAHLISHFKKGIGAVGPVSNYVAGLQKIELYFKENLSGQIDINVLENKLYHQNKGKSTETKLLIGFCMMLKREVIEKVGMVDEDLFLGNDDLDMSLRLRNNGYRLLVAADTFIYHKGQASFKTEKKSKTSNLLQQSADKLYDKLEKRYGTNNIPTTMELWGLPDWFVRPSQIKATNKDSFESNTISFTGERAMPLAANMDEIIMEEHWARYHLIEPLAEGNRVLDVACGTGYGSDLLAQTASYVIGGDISPETISYCKAQYKQKNNLQFNVMDIRKMPIAEKTFDFVVSFETLEHIVEGDQFLKEICRVLTKDGILAISTPIGGPCGNPYHVVYYQRESFKKFLIDYFKEVDIQFQRGRQFFPSSLSPSYAPTFTGEYGIAICRKPKKDFQSLTSIIILTHNQLEYTKKCIESIFKYTKDPFELIVVDNGSTDGTAQYLENLRYEYGVNSTDQPIEASKSKGRKKKKGKKKKAKKIVPLNKTCTGVTVFRNEKNLGFAAGNNQGMAVAKGDYALLMNNDVVVTPGWLKRMISCAEQSPKIGIVGPMSNFVSGPQLVKEVSYDTTSLDRLNKFAKEFAEKNSDQAKLIWRVVGFCMLIKRAVIDKIGGMDERYGLGNFEDDDFSLRAALGGFESRIAEGCFVHHFGSRTFIGANIDYRESLSEKWEIFKKKWGIPQDLPYGTSYDFSQIAKKGFIKEKHYCPLTEKDSSVKAEKTASFDLLETREEIDSKVKLKAIDKDITASIIIPVQKGQEQLEKCVESIRKHTSEPFELILTKNGSKNSTSKWLGQYVKRNRRYQLVACEKDDNIAKFYNEGIKASFGEYIVLLHSDVIVTKGWLTGLLECIKNNPVAGIVGPMTNNTIGVQKVPDADSATIEHLENYAKTFREKYRYRRVPIRFVNNFCMLFRHDLVGEIGLLDENLGFGSFENEDFCLRATLEGYKNLIAADVFIYKHNGKNQSISRKAFNEKWSGISDRSSLGKKLLASKALEKAVELDEKGQIDNAVKMLLEGMGHAPKDKKLNYAIAEMLINNKQFKDASDTLNEMPLDDQDVMKLALIGYCMEGMERYDEAEEYADRALPLDTASALAMNLKGILAFRKGDKATAEDFFKRAIESDPGYGEPYTNLGTLKWDQEAEEAFNLYEKGFILSPTTMDTVTIYHSAVTNLGKSERAEPIFRDTSVLHPNNRRLKFLLIDILVQQGKHDLAMEEIEGAMIAFGIDDGILSAALLVRKTLGSKEIEKSSKKNDTISLCMIVKNEEQHLGKCLMSVKPVVDEMIVVDTGSTDRTMDIARAFGARVYDFKWTNDFSEARNFSILKASGNWILILDADEVISSLDYASLRKITKKPTNIPVAYSIVTRNYTILTNAIGWVSNDGRYLEEQAGTGWCPSKKVRLFSSDSRVRFENPVHELVEHSLRRSGIKIKECSIPIHHYGKLNAGKVASKGEDYYLLGETKLKEKQVDIQSIIELAVQAGELGRYEDAVELWQRVIEIKPDSTKAFLNIGGAFLGLGKYEDALLASRKAMTLDPSLKEAVLNYSYCEVFIGDVEKAIAALENLLYKVPEYPPATAMLATAYFIDGKKEKGLKYINKVKKMGFNSADYLYERAKQFISAGKTDYALLLLETAVETDNVNRDVLSLLSECIRTGGTVVGNASIQTKNPEPISSFEIRQ